MTSLCVIPARSGSKRIPKKNILNLNNQPLLYYSLDAVKDNFDKIVLSSDSEEILELASKHNSNPTTWLRHEDLSTDTARAVDAVWDVIYNIEGNYDQVWWVLPTYPFITNARINDITTQLDDRSDSIVAICEFNFPPSLGIVYSHMPDYKSILPYNNHENFWKKNFRSQDQEVVYRPTGIYGAWTTFFLKTKNFFSKNMYGYLLNKIEGFDIDTPEDFKIAQALMRGENE